MSLLDAFLEDSLLNTVLQQQIFLAIRTDSANGAGTELDPYNCAGSATDASPRFDTVMAAIAALTDPITVFLQPGTYFTRGFNVTDRTGTWQPRGNMRILGSGADETTIQLCNSVTASKLTCAIGLDYTSATMIEGLEISDLGIDCGSSAALGGAANAAVGGIAVSGRNILIQRVHVKNMATVGTGFDSFGISAARAYLKVSPPYSTTPYNCVIANCRVDSPGANPSATCIGLHFATENDLARHDHCVIRDCVVDFGATNDTTFALSFCGISAGGGRGAIVERNEVRNSRYGGSALDKLTTIDLIVRNNYFFNVLLGISQSVNLGLVSMQRIIILNNVVEWPDPALVTLSPTGVRLVGNITLPLGQAVIRGNVIRRIDNKASQSGDFGIKVSYCTNAFVENNVVNVATPDNAFVHDHCGTLHAFNTRAADGTFFPGYDSVTTLHDQELTTDAENALLAL